MAEHKKPAPRAQRGETLAEVLVAMLIVALATLLLASMVMASAHINIAAREKDKTFYEALRMVEALDHTVQQPDPGTGPYQAGIYEGTTRVKKYSVDVYTSEDLTLYKKRP